MNGYFMKVDNISSRFDVIKGLVITCWRDITYVVKWFFQKKKIEKCRFSMLRLYLFLNKYVSCWLYATKNGYNCIGFHLKIMIIIVAYYIMENGNGWDRYKFHANTPLVYAVCDGDLMHRFIKKQPYLVHCVS